MAKKKKKSKKRSKKGIGGLMDFTVDAAKLSIGSTVALGVAGQVKELYK